MFFVDVHFLNLMPAITLKNGKGKQKTAKVLEYLKKEKNNLFITFHWLKGSLVMGDSNIIIGYEWGSVVQRQGLGKVQKIVKNCVGK